MRVSRDEKKRFIEKFWDLADEAFLYDSVYAKTRLAEHARREFNYSKKTMGCDIVSSLRRVWKNMSVPIDKREG
ncbi:MAG: hypothetical protein [Siphoviridae sp. ctCJE6]|nr:MAG: hypothetical protein [Siphoviridae sp. ctCJE6]